MTDKEKICKEVERLINELIQEKENGYGSDIDDACILELQNVLTFIDSLPKFKVGDKVRIKGTETEGDVIADIYTDEKGVEVFSFADSGDFSANMYEWELVEPQAKFKEGDWVVGPSKVPNQIVEVGIDSPVYTIRNSYGREEFAYIKDIDKYYHLWTIEEAKNGDVLYNKDIYCGDSVFIYIRGIASNTSACLCYVRLFKQSEFSVYLEDDFERGIGIAGGKFYPATKEQKDRLFKAIAENGYSWDSDKLELKKIEEPHILSDAEKDNAVDILLDGIDVETMAQKVRESIREGNYQFSYKTLEDMGVMFYLQGLNDMLQAIRELNKKG